MSRVVLAALILLTLIPCRAHAQIIQWIRQFGTAGSDQSFSVAVDSTGAYVSGFVSGALTGQVRAGLQDAFVRKYDSKGNLVWTRQFGTASNDVAFATAAGPAGIIVAGSTEGGLATPAGFGGQDMFATRLDANGNILGSVQLGTASNDVALGVTLDGNDVYFVGRTEGVLPGQTGAGGADVIAGRFNVDGTAIWVVQFGTSAADTSTGVAVHSSGVYFVGTVGTALPGQPTAGGNDAFIRKYSLDGVELWTRQFGTSVADTAANVTVDATGVYVSGTTGGDLPGQTTAGGSDGYVRKYDHNGNELWTRQFGTAANDTALDLVAFSSAVYVEGRTAGTMPGQQSAGGQDMYVRKYDADGTEQWTMQLGTTGDDLAGGGGLAVDASGVYLAGDTGTGQALPGQTNAGSLDVFLANISLVQLAPAVSPGGVVNNASYAPSPAPVAPGSIAAVFGSNMNSGSTVLSSSFGTDGKLVTSLGGTRVTINGIAAPMFYSTSGQLGVQIPIELAGQTSASIQVTVGNLTSQPINLPLDSAAPGIFTVNQSGTGIAAVLHQDGVTPVTTANPARRNEVVVFYGTGLGAVTPALTTGERSTGNRTVTAATVTIDGAAATVEFSGTAPGFVGLNQINVRIPANARQSSTIPVVLTIGGKQSNSVTIPVAP